MRETRVDYELLSILVAVAQLNSFSRAAARLGVSKGTVSRAVARLEAAVGAQLVHRTTHAVSLSAAGTALYERVAPHIAALNGAVQELPEKAPHPSGLLRMTAPRDFGLIVLPAALPPFLRRYPGIRCELDITNDIVDPVAAGYDLAIRGGPPNPKDSSLTGRKLANTGLRMYASPSYVTRRGMPKHVADASHDWIVPAAAVTVLKMSKVAPRVVCNDFFATRELVREGVGVGLMPRFVAAGCVREGLMHEVPIAHRVLREDGRLTMLYSSSRQVSSKVAAFRDYLVTWLRDRPLD